MTDTVDAPPTADDQLVRRRRWLVPFAIVVAAALVIVTASVAGWKWRHPTEFLGGSNGINQGTSATVGEVEWIGMTYPNTSEAPRTIHIKAVHPRVSTNTANAQVSAFICDNIQPPGNTELALGSVRGDVSKYCSTIVPARDVDMPMGRGHLENIVLRIVATTPGQTVVHGIDVDYSSGWQTGTQWTGYGVRVTAR